MYFSKKKKIKFKGIPYKLFNFLGEVLNVINETKTCETEKTNMQMGNGVSQFYQLTCYMALLLVN